MTQSYPVKEFLGPFAEPDDSIIQEVDKQNKPGGRPGLQHKFEVKPIDDVYPNGKPYKGAGKLEGKVALIAGGDSGIGRAIAILFAIEGAKGVSLNYLPKEEKDAEDVKAYIEKKVEGKTKVHLFPTDLKEEKNCIAAVEAVVKEFGSLDILVNNAAQQLENTDITTLPSDQWLDTFQINMHSYFYTSKAAIPHLKPGSSVINMCSINAFVGRPDLLDYTSTKGAIVSFTRGLSNQILADKQIRVNSIAPGPIWTPLVPSTFGKENMKGFTAPCGRAGQPVEIATVAVFLASEDSSMISGQTIHANGGTVIN